MRGERHEEIQVPVSLARLKGEANRGKEEEEGWKKAIDTEIEPAQIQVKKNLYNRIQNNKRKASRKQGECNYWEINRDHTTAFSLQPTQCTRHTNQQYSHSPRHNLLF